MWTKLQIQISAYTDKQISIYAENSTHGNKETDTGQITMKNINYTPIGKTNTQFNTRQNTC